VVRKHVYLEGQRVAEVVTDSSAGTQHVYFLVADQVGSLQVMTAEDGTVAQRVKYKPYGEISSMQSGDMSLAFGFAGARPDDGTGLNDFGARFYDPALGRFLSVDPIVQNPLDAMDLNPYGYARANPVSFFDVGGLSTGDCPGDACLQTGGGQGGGGQHNENSFSFTWSGHLSFGGLWGGLRGFFHGLGDRVQGSYNNLRDGLQKRDEGNAGSHPTPTGGTGPSGAPGPQTSTPEMPPPSTRSPNVPSDITGGTDKQREAIAAAREKLLQILRQDTSDYFDRVGQDVRKMLGPNGGIEYHIDPTLVGTYEWVLPSNPTVINISPGNMLGGDTIGATLLHGLGHSAQWRLPWLRRMFYGSLIDKNVRDIIDTSPTNRRIDGYYGYAAEVYQYGRVVLEYHGL
jgi:RHS repeat-associated protein